jgi:hypothetical protein
VRCRCIGVSLWCQCTDPTTTALSRHVPCPQRAYRLWTGAEIPAPLLRTFDLTLPTYLGRFTQLQLVASTCRCLWRGRPQDGTPVFDRLEYPSFVEFDDVNSKVLSYNAVTR